ncbi:MAG: thiamine pyrophosphate-binding protein [Chloroflexi bacterium]|nr:thiamine pyrophosphate-binding protein [Chloroflexota bacterium]
MIGQTDALKTLLELCTDEPVIGGMSAGQEWAALSPGPLSIPVAMSMGYGASYALGLALARPDRKVIILDGDGSVLMNLGCLVTLASASPANLIHFVFENGLYAMPGDIPLPAAGKFSLSGLARGAGLRNVYEFDDLADFRERIPGILRQPGPTFISLKVVPGPNKAWAEPNGVSGVHGRYYERVQAFRDAVMRGKGVAK